MTVAVPTTDQRSAHRTALVLRPSDTLPGRRPSVQSPGGADDQAEVPDPAQLR